VASKYRLEIELRGLPPLQTAAPKGVHWATAWRIARRWKRDVALAVSAGGRPAAPLARARVRLTRCSAQEPDPDNLASSFKPLLDALVESCVLEGDTPEHFVGRRPEYAWQWAARGAGHVRIEVTQP
jgi:hypothetical protein